MAWVIERFARHHVRDGFVCGNPLLDDFLTRYASQYEKRNVGRTYVLTRGGEARVWGYFTLAASQMQVANLPPEAAKHLPRHPIPSLLLGRLAVDQSVHGEGLGGMLLRRALREALAISEQIGVFAVVVDAIDENAVQFYQRFGFERFVEYPNRLFLTISTVRQSG